MLQRDAREGFRQHTEKIFLRSLNLSQEGRPQDFSLPGAGGIRDRWPVKA